MSDEPKASVYPRGLGREFPPPGGEFPDGPPTVVVTHRGARFVLRFAEGDLAGEGQLQALWVLPLEAETLEPRALRKFAPVTEMYLAYARARMRFFGAGPLDEHNPEADMERRVGDIAEAAALLREYGGPGRGLPPEFYKLIAGHYNEFVANGEPHPTKALAAAHHRSPSAASRWVTEAKRRGLISRKGAKSRAR